MAALRVLVLPRDQHDLVAADCNASRLAPCWTLSARGRLVRARYATAAVHGPTKNFRSRFPAPSRPAQSLA